MKAKRKKKKRKRMKKSSFKLWPLRQVNYLFNGYLDGTSIFQIAETLGKSEQSIEMCWRRLMYNASDKDYIKHYDLTPSINTRKHLNQAAKDYIKVQYTDYHINASAEELETRMGFSAGRIEVFIIHQGWVSGLKPKGLLQ